MVLGALGLNVLLLAFFGLGFRRLWFVISTLQLICHLPLMNVMYPAHVIQYCSFLIDITSLGFLPMKFIKSNSQSFVESQANRVYENFRQLEYDTNEVLLNFGVPFPALIIAGIIGSLHFLFHRWLAEHSP